MEKPRQATEKNFGSLHNDSYFAYRMDFDDNAKKGRIDFCGSGEHVKFHIIMPEGRNLRGINLNSETVPVKESTSDEGVIASIEAKISGLGRIEFDFSDQSVTDS